MIIDKYKSISPISLSAIAMGQDLVAERSPEGAVVTNSMSPLDTRACKHCGLSLHSYQVDFCCPGCRGIFYLISELGLNKVYEMPGSLPTGGVEMVPIHLEALKTLDGGAAVDRNNSSEASEYLNSQARGCGSSCEPFESITLNVEGMNCNACVWLLEGLSNKVKGLISVRVNLTTAQVALIYDRSKVLPSEVALLIERLGYRIVLGGSCQPNSDSSSSDMLIRVAFSGYCAMNIMLFSLACYGGYFEGIEFGFNQLFRWLSFILTLPVIVYCAQPIWSRAFNALKMGLMHLDVPICLGTALTFVVSTINLVRGNEEIYFDSISGLVFLLLSGRWLQRRMVQNAVYGADKLTALLGGYARRAKTSVEKDVQEIIAIDQIKKGDQILVESGERACVDGTSESEQAEVDRSFLTGESRPVILGMGERIFAGDLNLGKTLRVRADDGPGASNLSGLLRGLTADLVVTKGEVLPAKSPEVRHHNRKALGTGKGLSEIIAPYFTWAILGLSLVTFILWLPQGVYTALSVTVSLLIVACPCAFGVALPAIEAISSARAAKLGILVKRIEVLERLATIREVVFDKTGTLTVNRPHVLAFESFCQEKSRTPHGRGFNVNENSHTVVPVGVLKALIVSTKVTPWHPVSVALADFIGAFTENNTGIEAGVDFAEATASAEYEAGAGVRIKIEGREWRVGSISWAIHCLGEDQKAMPENKLFTFPERYRSNPLVVASEDGEPRGLFVLSQEPRRGIAQALDNLTAQGFDLHLLSGDRCESVASFVKTIGAKFKSVLSGQTPQEKLNFVRSIRCAMVGDGINDAAALEVAEVGIAVSGGVGMAFRAGDVYVLNPDGGNILSLFRGAKNVKNAVRLSFFVSLIYNLIGVSLATSGVLSPLIAALMMPISSLSMLMIALVYPSFRREIIGKH